MSRYVGRWLRSLSLLVCGAILGAGGGALVYKSLQVKPRPRPALPEPPGIGPEVVAELAAVGPEFFAFPVPSANRRSSAPEPASPSPTARPLIQLRLMDGRCIAGFDGTSSLYDFTGWTKAVTGEGTYELGRLAETAKAWVVADARTLDTGDAERDAEIHSEHLESAKFPQIRFELAQLKMTGTESGVAVGTLEIHGVRQNVTVSCTIRMRLDGYVHMTGEVRARMSVFGIRPPSKLGVVKVADELRFWFEIWAEPVKERLQ